MTDLRKVPLPRTPAGQVTWDALAPYLELTFREILARFDPRNPQNDFATALVVDADGAATIGIDAKVSDQRTLPMVNAGNRLSAQSTNPLTSTGSASTAAIAVAAHTVQYGFGTVSYGSGSISGLTPNTLYYVYADDPTYAGGVVSYTATTTPTTVVAASGRYYVGVITTAISSPTGNISAASSANPIQFDTSSAHGLTSGQTVTLSALPGDFGTNLNGNNYTVTVVDADSFTIAVDGSLYVAYTSGGSFTRVSTPTGGGGTGGGCDYQYNIP